MRYLYILLLIVFLTSCSTPYSELQVYIKASKEQPEDFIFVLNGIVFNDSTQRKLSELNVSDIAVVKKINQPAAKAIYGNDARPNTIIINTKSLKK